MNRSGVIGGSWNNCMAPSSSSRMGQIWTTYLIMTSYWSMWDPRWLPWRMPPFPTTTHRLHLSSLLKDGGRPGWGIAARARAKCSSLPWSPRGGVRFHALGLSCWTNTGMSRRPLEQDSDLRWSRPQWGWHGRKSRRADRFSKAWGEEGTVKHLLLQI